MMIAQNEIRSNYEVMTEAELNEFNEWIDDCKDFPFDDELDSPGQLAEAGWTKIDELPCEHMVELYGTKAEFMCAACYAHSRGFDSVDRLIRVSDNIVGISNLTKEINQLHS